MNERVEAFAVRASGKRAEKKDSAIRRAATAKWIGRSFESFGETDIEWRCNGEKIGGRLECRRKQMTKECCWDERQSTLKRSSRTKGSHRILQRKAGDATGASSKEAESQIARAERQHWVGPLSCEVERTLAMMLWFKAHGNYQWSALGGGDAVRGCSERPRREIQNGRANCGPLTLNWAKNGKAKITGR
jgi:hypothetical protein